jgi:ammonium transporter, Amt family
MASAAFARWRWPSSSALASASKGRTANRVRSRRIIRRSSSLAHSSCCSAGWALTPARPWGASDLRISVIAVNTNLSAVADAASAMFLWYYLFGKPDITMACDGMLVGLVAITAPCAFVSPNSAVVIGILAGILVDMGVLFNERVIEVDDPCGAISVHGYCGWVGAVCLGIFADGTYGAGWNGIGATSYLGKAGRV